MAGLNKYRAYLEYNFTNIEGLVQLPSHWELKQVRYLLKDGAEGTKIGPFGSSLKLEDMVDDGVQVYGQENVIKRDFSLGKRRISFNKFKEMGVYEVFSGDILITMMGTSGKCEIVPQTAEKGIIDSHLIRVRVNNKLIIPDFFKLLVDESPEIKHQIKIQGKGSIMLGLNSGVIRSLYLPLPKVSEQQIILSFLDYETAKIDNLIEKQQQLIELLKEKRQAVISHAVTKGLNPDVPMKDSGVEWLGKIPKDWQLKQIRHLCTSNGGGTPSKNNPNFWVGNIPWVSPKDMKFQYISDAEDHVSEDAVKQSSTKKIPTGSVLIVVRGMILAHSVPVAINTKVVTINQDMKALVPNENISCDYLHLVLSGLKRTLLELTDNSAHGTKCLRTDLFEKLWIPLPSLKQQKKIISEINEKVIKIDSLIHLQEEAKVLLQERRTALISAAVTGKIDVRDWVAPDVQDIEASQEVIA